MAKHRNRNGFTRKRTKEIACITVQYRDVATTDLKVNVVAGNTRAPSSVGSFSFTGSPTREDLVASTNDDKSSEIAKPAATVMPSISV